MGQMFHACAYDIETRTCCVIDADKFDSNCYSCSGTVFSMHYLLRQKPYRIMWGGGYAVIHDNLEDISRTEDLLGISTYEDYKSFKRNNRNLQTKSYYDKVKFIEDNSKLWKEIDVWDEAEEYFDWENTHSVKYKGYLVNHTQKLAVDLEDYYMQSHFLSQDHGTMAIDVVPVMTETGGGMPMVFLNGISTDSTEELAGKWCGDLLQITDELPEDYELINCCFAEVWSRAEYYYYTFGINEDGYLLNDSNGKLFEAAKRDFHGGRRTFTNFKIEVTEDYIKYIPVQGN